MRHPVLFFDCDMTLLDFETGERNAIRVLADAAGFDFATGYPRYHAINAQCWKALEEGRLSQKALMTERFARFLPEVGCTMAPEEASRRYEAELAKQGIPFPFTRPLLEALRREGHRLYITTNGNPGVQHGRYATSGLDRLTDGLFISAEIGYAKPDPRFFTTIMARLSVDPADVAVIGDSLSSDVRGGLAAGLYTVWYNPSHLKAPAGLSPSRETDDLLTLVGTI